MLELAAVEAMVVEIDQSSVSPSGFPASAAIVTLPPPARKTQAQNRRVYLETDETAVNVITCPTAGATIADPLTYTVKFVAENQKVKEKGVLLLREGDKSTTISAVPKIPGSPPGSPPVDYPISFKIMITSAAQTKAKIQ